ncbi:hypothetical protein [Amazonocrinis nigriterrae]|uniref:hypothetical protein n=1 Tax=Amazonocrinis nigriterrae TaxID=2840443 RepID=UPI001CEC841E|nr:hypothetical protein [Amazonocrinis nigriterrae]
MPAIVKLQLSLETLAEAISSLDLIEKRQLQELIEQQIFEAEEALYEDDAQTQAEIQAVRAEYKDGDFMTVFDLPLPNPSPTRRGALRSLIKNKKLGF